MERRLWLRPAVVGGVQWARCITGRRCELITWRSSLKASSILSMSKIMSSASL